MSLRSRTALTVALGILLAGGRAIGAGGPAPSRDFAGVEASVPRFGQVDARLFRGGQPDRTGFESLRALGIRTVINLRGEHDERQLVEGLGLNYVYIPISPTPLGFWSKLPESAARKFFETTDDPASGPVFVHCRRGADRTGVVVGLYRIARQHWDGRAAYREARQIGMRWWYGGFKAQLYDFAAAPAESSADRVGPASLVPEGLLPE